MMKTNGFRYTLRTTALAAAALVAATAAPAQNAPIGETTRSQPST